MISTHILGAEAASKDGMTLDELAAFVAEAQKAGVRGNAQPKVTIKFGGRIRKIEVKG